jgi:hypothetical protein
MLQFVIVAVTLYAIYRQVRLQAAAAAIEQVASISREWMSEAMARHRLAVLTALRDGDDPAHIPPNAAGELSNFWERVAYLVREGHIDTRLVHEYFSSNVRLWWEWLEPNNRMERERRGEPAISEHFEWLAQTLAEMDRQGGVPVSFDEAYRTQFLPEFIETNAEAIRAFEEQRAVIVRSASTALEPPRSAARPSRRG